VLDVGDVDLVDQTVDGLFESLPGHALKFLGRRIVADLSLQGAQSSWRHVGSSRAHVEQALVLGLCSSLLLGGRQRFFFLHLFAMASVGLSLPFESSLTVDITGKGAIAERKRRAGTGS
jgi:hypothetical protein